MQSKTTWVLACDASRARLYREENSGKAYSLIESFEHPESRKRVVDLVAGEQGRKPVGVSMGEGGVRVPQGGGHGRPGAAPETDPKEVEAQKFARELATALEQHLFAHAFDALVLAAPPHFLGLVKATLSDQVAKRVRATVCKDLAQVEPRDLGQHLKAAKR